MELTNLINTLAVGLAAYYAYYWLVPLLRCWARYYLLASRIPGPAGYPLIGHLFDFLRGPKAILATAEVTSSCDATKFWALGRLVVFLSKPDDIEAVLKSKVHVDKTADFVYYEPWLIYGIYLREGIRWDEQRTVLTKIFQPELTCTFVEPMNREAFVLSSEFSAKSGSPFDCYEDVCKTVTRILCDNVLGRSKDEEVEAYLDSVRRLHRIVQKRIRSPWLAFDLIFRLTKDGRDEKALSQRINGIATEVYKSFKSIQAKGKPTQEENNSVGEENEKKCVIKSIIDIDEEEIILTHEEAVSLANTFIYMGCETTATVASFFFCIMACRPDIQEKCRNELDTIFDGSKRHATERDLQEMKYLERCLMETLRLFSPQPYILRRTGEELQLATSDFIIPSGATVVLCTSRLHRDPNIYTHPNSFDPDNFLEDKLWDRHYFSYIPFSAGPRSCFGRKYAMTMLKVIVSTILRFHTIKEGEEMKKWVVIKDHFLSKEGGFKFTIDSRMTE